MELLPGKMAGIICICTIGLTSYAEAKWSIPKHAVTEKSATAVNVSKIQSHYVQIFSSMNATKAEGMKNTLEMHGYPAFVNIRSQSTQALYQVQIGPFSSKNLANNVKTSIIQRYPEYTFLNESILKIAFSK